ncbi:MAG TPA: hypothetical protein VGP07_02825 [Polyangia bacterium]
MTRRHLGRASMGALVIVVATLLGAPSHAAPGPAERLGAEEAREHFQRGEAFFKLEKYNDALGEYEKGYLAKSDASFLYNIAQCHRLMGDKPAALRFYRRFLSEATRVPNRTIVEQHIHDLEAALAAAPPPAAPPPAPAPLPIAIDPAPAPVPILGDTPDTAPAASASREKPIYQKWWFWTAIGVALVGAGVITYAATRSSGSSCEAGRVCM